MPPRPKTGAIDEAEAWIIATRDATYREAAANFGVTHNAIRARIANKYGSLAEARNEPERYRDARRRLIPVLRCIRCRETANIEQGLRMCACCRKEVAKIHEGGV